MPRGGGASSNIDTTAITGSPAFAGDDR